MKPVCEALGVARSNLHARSHRAKDWRDARKNRTPAPDEELLSDIRRHIADLPSYGYRRACALVNRQRRAEDRPVVNPKRAYRVMAEANLLLPKAPRRPQARRAHEGKVAVAASNVRWCSDGFEIRCDSGETVTATFAKDCCDREIMAWRAWPGKGLPGEPVREMLIEAVEKRFGAVEAVFSYESTIKTIRQEIVGGVSVKKSLLCKLQPFCHTKGAIHFLLRCDVGGKGIHLLQHR